jgi:thiamine biosynthesis lipoprotein
MGTLVGVSVRGEDPSALEAVTAEVFGEMRRLESVLSEWSPASAVSRVNDAAGTKPVEVPREVIEVLDVALQVARATKGAFDPTWAALAPLWRLGDPAEFHPPDATAVATLRQLVDHRDVIVDTQARTVLLRRRGMRLGFGGVAKAYIAERGADFAVARGVSDVLVDAGGDIVARGRNGERPWTAGIRAPRSHGELLATVELYDEAIVTSGDYEHYVEADGRRYHHLLDPRSGWPASRCQSATVIAPSGALADALATGAFVLGDEELDVVSAWAGVAAMIVCDGGDVRFSTGADCRFLVRR